MDRQYHTIDPLIMETLNLNQRRITHIFDILHGKDSQPYSQKTDKKLPALSQIGEYNRSRNPRQQTLTEKKRVSSVRVVNSQKNQLTFEAEDVMPEKSKVPSKRSPAGRAKPTKSIFPQQVLPSKVESSRDRNQQVKKDYGNGDLRRNKSMELNPKDIYRMEIEHLVSQLTPIEQLEDSDKMMKRLKRRYQHLRKFDKAYYINLNKNDLFSV